MREFKTTTRRAVGSRSARQFFETKKSQRSGSASPSRSSRAPSREATASRTRPGAEVAREAMSPPTPSAALVCPPGWAPDNFLYRYPAQCLLPANAYLWLLVHYGVLFACTTAFFIRVACLNTKMKVRGYGQAALLCGFASTLGAFMVYVGVYIQNGYFEVASAFVSMGWLGALGAVSMLLDVCLEALASTKYLGEGKRLTGLVWISTGIAAAAFCSFSAAYLATCRRSDAEFNTTVSAVLVGQGVLGVWFNVIVTYVMRHLEAMLVSLVAQSDDFFHRYAARVRHARWVVQIFLTLFALSTLAVGIVGFVLGYFPFTWLVISLSLDSSLGVLLALLIFVERDSASQAATSALAVVQQVVSTVASPQTSLRALRASSQDPEYQSSTASSYKGRSGRMPSTPETPKSGGVYSSGQSGPKPSPTKISLSS